MATVEENDDDYKKRKKIIILAAAAAAIGAAQYSQLFLNKEPYRGKTLRCRKKRKKGGVDKISSALKAIATAINMMVMNDSMCDLAYRLVVAIDALPGIDSNKRLRAKIFFIERKNLAMLFLEANEEDKPKILDMYL